MIFFCWKPHRAWVQSIHTEIVFLLTHGICMIVHQLMYISKLPLKQQVCDTLYVCVHAIVV